MLSYLLYVGILFVGESIGQYNNAQAYDPQSNYRSVMNNYNGFTGWNSPQINSGRSYLPNEQWQQAASSNYYNPYSLRQWSYVNPYSTDRTQAQPSRNANLPISQRYYSKDRSDGYGYNYAPPSYNLPYYNAQDYLANFFYGGAGYDPRWMSYIRSFGDRRQDMQWNGPPRRNGLSRTTPQPPKTTTTTTEAPRRKNVPRKSKLFVPNVWG